MESPTGLNRGRAEIVLRFKDSLFALAGSLNKLASNPRVVYPVFGLLVLGMFLSSVAWQIHAGRLRLVWERLPLTGIRHEIGAAYQGHLGTSRMSAHRRPSPAQILEDGVPLGPANSMHDFIRKSGRGAYSFWGDYLYFSSSDNTDPRTNSRGYEVYWPSPVDTVLRWLIYSGTFLINLGALGLLFLIVRQGWVRLDQHEKVLASLSHVLREKDEVLFPILILLVSLTACLVAYFFYLITHQPVSVWGRLEWLLTWGATYLLLVLAGYIVPATWSSDGGLISALRGLVILAVAFFILVRPEAQISSLTGLIYSMPSLALAATAGALWAIKRRWSGQSTFSPVEAVWRNDRWLTLTILFAICLALPGLLKPLFSWWDISGYMDSHMYDRDAHMIATWIKPEGNSFVMPLYQYGMAFFYFVFGHFFYVQQVISLLLAMASISLLCLTAWEIFRDLRAVLLMGLLAAFTKQLYRFIHITQVENWYIPLICLTVYAWSRYWRKPVTKRAIFLGLATGLAFNCRAQGAFFFALLCLTPLFLPSLNLKKKVLQVVVVGLVTVLTLLPWTLRNYVYENRFSPSTDQSIVALLFNDHRVGFYGLRFDLYSWQDALREYENTYSNKNERFQAIQRDFWKNTFGDFGWLVRAVSWRSLAFYGLLPPGIWAPDGPEPTDWNTQWYSYVFWGIPSFFYLGLAVMGILRRPGRTTLFLFLAILANLAVLIFASQREARIHYPVLPFHMLLGLCILFKPFSDLAGGRMALPHATPNRKRRTYYLIGGSAVVLFLLLCHLSVGRKNLYRPLLEQGILVSNSALENRRAASGRYRELSLKDFHTPEKVVHKGEKVRVKCKVTNYMLPPKSAGAVTYLPRFASDPTRETYYYAYTEDGQKVIGVTYLGAAMEEIIREGDLVEIEGEVVDDNHAPMVALSFWLKAEAIYK